MREDALDRDEADAIVAELNAQARRRRNVRDAVAFLAIFSIACFLIALALKGP